MAQVDFGDHNSFVPRSVEGFLREVRKRARLRVMVAAMASAAMLGIFALVLSTLN